MNLRSIQARLDRLEKKAQQAPRRLAILDYAAAIRGELLQEMYERGDVPDPVEERLRMEEAKAKKVKGGK